MESNTEKLKTWANENLVSPNVMVSQDEDRTTLEFSCLSAENDFVYRGSFVIIEGEDQLDTHLYAPLTIPNRKLAEAAVAVAMINYGCRSGRLDLNVDDGTLRYSASVSIAKWDSSDEILSDVLNNARSVLDRYLPAISDVVYSNIPPNEAIAQAEGNGSLTSSNWQPENDCEPSPWERFPGSGPLRAWSQELGRTCDSNPDAANWAIVGRAALVVSDDKRFCREALHRVAYDAGMRFIFVGSSDVFKLHSPVFFRKLSPVLIYLEPGRWMLRKQEDEDDEITQTMERFQEQVAGWIRSFDPTHPVVYVTSASKISHMVEDLRQVGLFDRFFNLPQPTLEVQGESFIDSIGRELCGESIVSSPGKVGKLLSMEYEGSERREKLAGLRMQRLFAHQDCQLEFLDLVNLVTHGLVEEDTPSPEDEDTRRQKAFHEAGHAAIAVIDSNGKNVPDYASIVPAAYFQGVVVESYSYHYAIGEPSTYQGFRHSIRVSLAGRAAEDVVLGPERISSGARSDLENATRLASQAFALWGYAPSMEEEGQSATNLAVIVGEPSASELVHFETLVREFLAAEYTVVKSMISANRSYLCAIADRLMWDPILDQKGLFEISQEHLKLANTD